MDLEARKEKIMYEPSYDGFSRGVTPKVPDEVGDCAACGGKMYDYEVIKCLACDAEIHQGCIETCDGELCGQIGCRACLTENEEGLLLCEECKYNEEIKKQVLAAMREAEKVQ